MNTAEIKKMDTSERLQAMEAIWNALVYDDAEMKSPDWHEEIIKERMKAVKEGTAKSFSIDELKVRNRQ